MKKLLSLLFVCILWTSSLAQSGYFAIEAVHKGKEFRFPVLIPKRNRRIETKMNQHLQLSELLSLAGQRKTNIFEQVMINDGSIYGRKVSLSYEVFANNPRILSIGFFNSTDGATTHWWSSYYTFNAQNGDRISLRDLFSESGYQSFIALVTRKRSESFKAEVARKIQAAEREAFLGLLGIIESDELDDFSLSSNGITIRGENILGKASCCVNLNMTVGFELRKFQQWLNDYGKTIFGIRSGNLAKFRSNRLPQLFAGTVNGTSRFVAVLRREPLEQIEGIYAYLRFRKGIYLTGSVDGTHVQLTEHVLTKTALIRETDSSHRWMDGGSIVGTFDDSMLSGVWTDKENQKSLRFVANRR